MCPPGPDARTRFPESGWLLWVRAGTQTLVAQRLDVEKAALTGNPVTVADGLALDTARRRVSVAAAGTVAYRTGTSRKRQLTWVDRSGTVRGTVGDPDASVSNPRLSPDGRRVAINRIVEGNSDIWLLDGDRASRFTFDAAADNRPVWARDGARIVFRSTRAGLGDLYQRLTSGAGAEEVLMASDRIEDSQQLVGGWPLHPLLQCRPYDQ